MTNADEILKALADDPDKGDLNFFHSCLNKRTEIIRAFFIKKGGGKIVVVFKDASVLFMDGEKAFSYSDKEALRFTKDLDTTEYEKCDLRKKPIGDPELLHETVVKEVSNMNKKDTKLAIEALLVLLTFCAERFGIDTLLTLANVISDEEGRELHKPYVDRMTK